MILLLLIPAGKAKHTRALCVKRGLSYTFMNIGVMTEDGRWKMEDGRWKMEDGRWKMEDGRWKTEDGRWKMEDGRRKMEDGRWKMEDGRWKMEDGRWKMEDGRWKMEDGRWKMDFLLGVPVGDGIFPKIKCLESYCQLTFSIFSVLTKELFK